MDVTVVMRSIEVVLFSTPFSTWPPVELRYFIFNLIVWDNLQLLPKQDISHLHSQHYSIIMFCYLIIQYLVIVKFLNFIILSQKKEFLFQMVFVVCRVLRILSLLFTFPVSCYCGVIVTGSVLESKNVVKFLRTKY